MKITTQSVTNNEHGMRLCSKYPSIFNRDITWRSVVSFRPESLRPRRKNSKCSSDMRFGGSQRTTYVVANRSRCSCRSWSPTAQATASHFTDWATPLNSVWLRAGRLGFDPWQGQGIFLLAPASRPALRPTQPPIQWVLEVLSPGVKRGRGVTLTNHPHLVPRLSMSRSYTSSHPMCLHGMQQDSFTFFYFTTNAQMKTSIPVSAWCGSQGLWPSHNGAKNSVYGMDVNNQCSICWKNMCGNKA
jgi:hypothetical protein